MRRKYWIWGGGLLAAALVIGLGGWALRDQLAYANIATGYAAKQTCSCMYVSGRSMDSCITDFPDEAGDSIRVRTSDERVVRASVLFGAISARAQFEEGYGCRILD